MPNCRRMCNCKSERNLTKSIKRQGVFPDQTLIKMDHDKVKGVVKIVQKQNLTPLPYNKGHESKTMLFLKKYRTALWYLSKEAIDQIQTCIRFSESSPLSKKILRYLFERKLGSEKREYNILCIYMYIYYICNDNKISERTYQKELCLLIKKSDNFFHRASIQIGQTTLSPCLFSFAFKGPSQFVEGLRPFHFKSSFLPHFG